MPRPVPRVIAQYANKYNLDPRAVQAVAFAESTMRRNAVGDNGTSFGPFQMHQGGALPSGRNAAWAGSDAGIEYAVRTMAPSARGLRGRAAIDAIVRKFERPAQPGQEVNRAFDWYTSGRTPASGNVAFGVERAKGTTMDRSGIVDYALASSNALLNGSTAPALSDYIRRMVQPRADDVVREASTAMPGVAKGARGGLREAFYDPLGGYDEGKFIGAIGGHNDHVHVSADRAATMLAAIRHAQGMGMSTRENPYVDPVDPVHTKGSYHYRTLPGSYGGKKLGEGLDVSGSPEQMAAYYRWLTNNLR